MRAASARSCWSIECLRVVVTSLKVKRSAFAFGFGETVENMWKTGGQTVDVPTTNFFFVPISPQTAPVHSVRAPSSVLSLEPGDPHTRMLPHSRDKRGHIPEDPVGSLTVEIRSERGGGVP